jgi:hypothetical protein
MAMATTTVVETFPKGSVTREQVEAERRFRLSAPDIVSSEIRDEPINWVLETVIKLDQ